MPTVYSCLSQQDAYVVLDHIPMHSLLCAPYSFVIIFPLLLFVLFWYVLLCLVKQCTDHADHGLCTLLY